MARGPMWLVLEVVPDAAALPWWEIGFFALLLAASGFLSGAEVAFLTFSRLRRRHHEEAGTRGIKEVQALLARPQRFLVTILVGNNLVNIGAAALATRIAIDLFGEGGVAIATGVTTFLVLTFSEITPKTYASQNNEGMALRTAPIILWIQRVLFPVVWLYERFSIWLIRRFGVETAADAARQFANEEELRTLITIGAEEGVIEEREEEMLHSVIALQDTRVREIMLPRPDVVAVPADAPLERVRTTIVESGYSRFPVHDDGVDNIVGVLYARDALAALSSGEGARVARDLMRPPTFVPEAKRVAELIAQMRAHRVHMAVVVDEYGGTAGVVTLEDALEEIVGEIFDEYDVRDEPVRVVDDATAIVDARMNVDDLNRALDLSIPTAEGAYDTVGGFILHRLGRLAREGESVRVAGTSLVVERAAGRRILRVRVHHGGAADAGAAGGA